MGLLDPLVNITRGIWLMRNGSFVRSLGEQAREIRTIEQIREHNPGATVDDHVIVRGWPEARLSLGTGARVERGTIVALGDTLNGWGSLVIGSNTWVGEYNNFRCGGGDIVVGSECLISQFCSLVSTNHSTRGRSPIRAMPPDPDRRGVVLCDGVWIGAGSVVLPGCRLGEGAVLAAGSILLGDIPAFEIWAGHPARKIGERAAE